MQTVVDFCSRRAGLYRIRQHGVAVMLSLAGLSLFSCNRSDPQQDVVLRSDSCTVKMRYDGETTILIQPAKAAEAAQLSDLDKVLMYPVKERTLVDVCLSDDGTYAISTEYADPLDPIPYPENVAQIWPKPAYKRMLSENGKVSYFNDLGELIKTDGFATDEAAKVVEAVKALTALKQAESISDERFEGGLDTLSLYGMGTLTKNGDIITVRNQFPDNNYAISVISKKAHMQIGQLNYNAAGELTSLYMLKVDGVAPNVIWKRLYEVSFFNAVESNVKMKRQKVTLFNSFSLSIN